MFRYVSECIATQTRAVAEAIGQKDFEKAMSYRDPEFIDTLENFVATSSLDHTKKVPKEKVYLRDYKHNE